MARPFALRLLRAAVAVRDDEVRALLWSFLYFFSLLASYYVLRPLRDEMGVAAGVANLQWLFTATFAAMLVASPAFGWLAARLPRRRLVPIAYRAFSACILLFFAWLTLADDRTWAARAFFVWVSLFNLFVVSVFWSFMADLFREEQAKRLFGFVAAGGSAGAIAGPVLTGLLAAPLGPVNLLLVSAALLEVAIFCVARLLRTAPAAHGAAAAGAPIGGGALAGFRLIARSPFLAGIALYLLLYTATSTFLYFQQANIVAAASDDPAVRTRIFALIDASVGVLTVLVQAFVTGRLMRRIGLGPCLAVAPLVSLAGFAAIAAAPAVATVVAAQALRRALHFAISRPAREALFTVVGREAKYKSKNVLDLVVYRGGDMASGWAFAGLTAAGLALVGTALVALPASLLWAAVGVALGRRAERRNRETEAWSR